MMAQSHTGTQQTTRRPDVDGWSSGKEEALRHQLDCYRTAAKQLSVLLGHRNKEIEVLLQEMQLDAASSGDNTKAGDLIPAVWGKSTEALRISEPNDYLAHRTHPAMSQAGLEQCVSARTSASESGGLHPKLAAASVGHASTRDGSLGSVDETRLPSILGHPYIPASSPQDATSIAMRGSKEAAGSLHLSGMAEDDFSGVHFCEVFWALPERKAPASRSGSQTGAAFSDQGAMAWPQMAGLDAVVSDTSSALAESASGSQEHGFEQEAQSDRAAGELDVAKSQLQASQDLILSMQRQLGEAHDKQSAMSEQLRHTSACLQHLQRAQEAWKIEEALQATRVDAAQLRDSEAQDSDAAQMQVTEAALHQALRHEGQLMAEVISLQPVIISVPETALEAPWLSARAGEDSTPDVLQHAADAPLAAIDNGSARTEEWQVPQQGTKVKAAAHSQTPAKPEQLRHARSVIAELSARLAELECCNALLQDQLAISADDLIKSGPQHTWRADSFPWDDPASVEHGIDLSQDSVSVKSATNNTQDAQPLTPDEESLAKRGLLDESLTGGLSTTDSAGDAPSSDDAPGHTSSTEEALRASEEHAPSASAPAGHGQMADTWPDATPKVARNLTESAGSASVRMSFSRLSAAEEQNARLAATHAELERCLLHAQHQLRDFAGAASDQVPLLTAHSFHAAQEALTQAVAEVRSTGAHNSPELLPDRASAEPVRLSASSQQSPGRLNYIDAPRIAADLRSELAASKAKLARTAEQLAESELCREHLEQQLLDVGEARHNAHQRGLQDSSDMMAEVADSTAKLALLAQQLAEAAEREPSTTLEAATSEVAALRVAMTQSENIFLDLEAQLRAAFEREAASQLRIAALEQELVQAGMHARPASAMQLAVADGDGSAIVPFVQHQRSAPDLTMMQPQSLEAGTIVIYGSEDTQQAARQDMTASASSQQTQLLTAQLRAALQQVSDTETVIERLHDQIFNQYALITELRLALSASGQLIGIPDASLGAASVTHTTEAGSKALQLEYPVSKGLLKMAIVEEVLSEYGSQLGKAKDMQLVKDGSKAQQVVYPDPQVAASNSALRTPAKPALPRSAHISQLAVTCALIAGQTEFPEELYSLVLSEDSAPLAVSRDAHTSRVPARSDEACHSQSDAVREDTASAHSASQRMRENPLFLQGSANSSDEDIQGSQGEEEAHHRTVRGREAQQIVQRLKNSYLHRSMSAPDAALSPGMAGKEGAGRRAAVGRAAGRRRSSRQAQQRARPWSLPSLKRALAEQRRGSAATSSGSFGAKSSSYGSMLLEGEEEEDIEVLETIYANWGDIDQAPDVGERDDSKELTASLAERCAYLEKALEEASCRLAKSRAAEGQLQSQNSILRTENSALTARLGEQKQEQLRHKPVQREQAAYKPAGRATAASLAASPFGVGSFPGPAIAGSGHRAPITEADAGASQPCSRYAWELQDLHLRMAAAIAQIRELEADKAKVARQLVSACAGAGEPPRPASHAGQSADNTARDAAARHSQHPTESTGTLPNFKRD